MRSHVPPLAALCAALVFAAIPSTATARDQDAAASTFAVRTVRLLVANRYADAWRSLHPSHPRAVGSRARYVQCELSAPFVGRTTTIEALSVWDETAAIAGVGRSPTKAVTIRIVLRGIGEVQTVTHTVHVLSVRGSWRWVLPPARFASYRRGSCG
jgi:hypothetical protein